MKKARIATLVLLGVYVLLTAGVSFHYHPQNSDQVSLHCKLCELSRLPQEAASSLISIPVDATPYFFAEDDLTESRSVPAFVTSRAPPLS